MKKDKFKIGLDGLKLCFKDRQENKLFNRIALNDDIVWWGEEGSDDFYTFRLTDECDDNKQIVRIIIPDGDQAQTLGTMTIHKMKDKGKYNGFIFIEIENKALYTDLLHSLGYVLGCFDLQFNNVTSIVPCLTGTRNYIYKVQKMRRDLTHDMIYNGDKIVSPDATIKDWFIGRGCSRKREFKIPTLYFGQAKATGLKVRMYDKSRELKERSIDKKDYLNTWLGFKYDKLFRVEVEISNISMRELCELLGEYDSEYMHDDRILSQIFDEKFLFLLLHTALHKVVYWKNKEKTVDLLDH